MKQVILTILVVLALVPTSEAMGRKKKSSTDTVRARILEQRQKEIKRQAPKLGIPVNDALNCKVQTVYLCEQTGSNGDGSYTCNKECSQVSSCVHAWCATSEGSRQVMYMFTTPSIQDGCIAHEVHHELVVRFYGIGGHPARSEVKRKDNGQSLTIKHAEVIGWRWPSLVNWMIPESHEITTEWSDDLKCGTGEVFEDGGGI